MSFRLRVSRRHTRRLPTALAVLTALAAPAVASAQTSTAASRASNGLPSVSPDGAWIAFIADRGTTSRAAVIRPDGSQLRLIETPSAQRVLFLADGKRLMIAGAGADSGTVFVVALDGGAIERSNKVPGRNPILSPDGRRVAFLTGPWTANQLIVANADGSNAHQIAAGATTAWNPMWSPDGAQLAYTYGAKSSPLQVHITNADGSNDRALTKLGPDEGSAQMPSWNAKGNSLAVQVNSGRDKPAHVWRVDVNVGPVMKFNPHERYLDEAPSWFPDGKRLAFQSNRSGQMEIWVMSSSGRDARQVTGKE